MHRVREMYQSLPGRSHQHAVTFFPFFCNCDIHSSAISTQGSLPRRKAAHESGSLERMRDFVFVVMGITFYQERKTEPALEGRRDLSGLRARVVRDGQQKRIAGREVVPGDLIVQGQGAARVVATWAVTLISKIGKYLQNVETKKNATAIRIK